MWYLSPDAYRATVAKVEKINRRAEKRGFTGRITVKGERTERCVKNDLGFKVTEVVYETILTGAAPKYNGWTLLATLEWDPHAGLVVRTAPGIEKVDRTNLVEGKCDHCKTDRYRKSAYLVTNGAETLQVGSTCLKDFLGWKTSVAFISADSVSDDVDGFLGGGTYEREWATDTVLAVAWAEIQLNGWHPASNFGPTTKGAVYDILDPRSAHSREVARKYAPYIEKSYAQAKIVRDWVLSDQFSGDSEYVINLKNIARADSCTPRSLGFLVSAHQAWAKAQERDLVRRRERSELANEFVGEVGDHIEVEVTIKSIRPLDSRFGTTFLYTMLSTDHHLFKWFSSNKVLGETADERTWKIKGTVKKHDDWHGTKSTVLTRCKVIE